MELVFGLLGSPLKNTFSVDYFTQKFKEAYLPYSYKNFSLESFEAVRTLLQETPNLGGLNVTKPYKEKVVSLMHELSEEAQKCGAVNCIQFKKEGVLKGHNTDVFGFKKSLEKFIGSNRNISTLVIGNGGASKAVCYVLEELKIPYEVVSRRAQKAALEIDYLEVNAAKIEAHKLIVNTSPVGMFPHDDEKIALDLGGIGSTHYCYDLIYLPEKTGFLKEAELRGAKIKNGLEMLHLQADEAFRIWMAE
jgi:shikimate dehydrogenase